MNVFISWSGQKSKLVAQELQDWLYCIFQSIQFWTSQRDITIGSRWDLSLSAALDKTDFGIVCLTQENLNSPWILFEAGAISNKHQKNKLVPFLLDLNKTDLKGPLSFFQSISFEKEEIFTLVKLLSKLSPNNYRDSKKLEIVFEKWYPDLANKLIGIKQLSPTLSELKNIQILTSSEITILQLIGEGKSIREISDKLSKTRASTEALYRNLLLKLKVNSRTELIELSKYFESF